MAFELCTFAELKKVLDLEESSLINYPPLVVLKPAVEAAIESYIGRELESIERTESVYLSPIGSRMVKLKGLPITDITSVTVTYYDGSSDVLTAGTEYRATPFGIRLASKYSDVDVTVVYTGGFADDAVPDAIQRAALLQTVYEYEKSPNLGAQSVETEGGRIDYPEIGLLKHVKELLHEFVHPMKLGI